MGEPAAVVLRTVAVLYCDPRGPYPSMLGVDCWDEARDARAYAGPHPVVAHPPCGPWGNFRSWCTKQDPLCGPRAVEQVRAFGGVLEHPAHSRLFRHCRMPHPGELPDAYGGVTIEVDQVRWGHVAHKRTWLYLVGVRDVDRDPPPREPTHRVARDRRMRDPERGLLECSAQQRRRTPPAFAAWLLALARSADVERHADQQRSA